MMPDWLEEFRPYSHAEMDIMMAEYFKREKERKREEHAQYLAKIKQDEALRANPPAPFSHTNKYLSSPVVLSDIEKEDRNPDRADRADLADSMSQKLIDARQRLLVIMTRSKTNADTVKHSLEVTGITRDSAPLCSEEAVAVIPVPMPLRSDPPRAKPVDLSVFPIKSASEVLEFDEPMLEMEAISRELLTHKDYGQVRARYCLLSIRMNLEGRQAPRFRLKLISGAKRMDPIHMVMHRDRVVIDYHWCHSTKMVISANEAAHTALFDAQDFDFAAAWRLSAKKWTLAFRAAEALCLTRFQQSQTMTLHDHELVKLLKDFGSGWRASAGKSTSKLASVKRQINQWAERDQRIVDERHSYESLWIVREMLGPGASNSEIATLHALAVGGSVRDRASIRDRLKRLENNLRAS
jgi:hypothetical protein